MVPRTDSMVISVSVPIEASPVTVPVGLDPAMLTVMPVVVVGSLLYCAWSKPPRPSMVSLPARPSKLSPVPGALLPPNSRSTKVDPITALTPP